MAKILITGVAGFIGSHTAEYLVGAGHEVIGVDNFRSGDRNNLAKLHGRPGFSFFQDDISVPGILASRISNLNVSAIVHLAGLVSVQESISHPDLNFQYNVYATHLVAEAARLGKVPRIVFASSAAVYGDNAKLPISETADPRPISPYGAAKLASEILLSGYGATYGITIRSQRYFNVYGPRQDPASPYSGVISRFLHAFREHKPVTIFGDGLQTRDFVSVFDVARANGLAATQPEIGSGVANICTGRGISLLRLAEILRHLFPSAPAATYANAREGDIRDSVGQPICAARALDFMAAKSIELGLTEMAEAGFDGERK